jgi:hypothetical protein
VQEVLTIDESVLVIDDAILVINDAEKVEAPCKILTVTLFPNPCLGNFEIKGLGKENIEGFIYSLDGLLVSFVKLIKRLFSAGLYILKVKDSSFILKFVKQ